MIYIKFELKTTKKSRNFTNWRKLAFNKRTLQFCRNPNKKIIINLNMRTIDTF